MCRVIVLLVLVGWWLGQAGLGWAGVLTWDGDVAMSGLQDGSGPWNTTDSNRWYNNATSSYHAWSSATPDDAIFGNSGSGMATVTLPGAISAGTLTFNAGASYTLGGSAVLTLTGTSIGVASGQTATINASMAGATDMSKKGNGTLVVEGDNSGLRGFRSIVGGTLRLTNGNAMGGTEIHSDVNPGTTLEVIGGITVPRRVFLQGSGVGGVGALRSISGNNVFTGQVNLGDSLSATIAVDSDTLTLKRGIQTWPNANRGIIKTGAGKLIFLGNDSDYIGSTQVNGGTLAIRDTGQVYLGTTVDTVGTFTVNAGGTLSVTGGGQIYKNLGNEKPAAITVNAGGTLEIENWALSGSLGNLYFRADNIVVNGGTIRTIGSSNPIDNSGGGRTFTIGAAGATLESAAAGQTWSIVKYNVNVSDGYPLVSQGGLLTLTGVGNGLIGKAIPGAGGLTKRGTGTWTLSGANTYSGTTSVESGTLLVDGSIADKTTVSGGLLGGNGRINGAVAIGTAGTISAGHSPGLLTIVGDYIQSGTLLAEIGGLTPGASGYDQVAVTGTATLDAGSTISVAVLAGFVPTGGSTFDILTATGGITADLSQVILQSSGTMGHATFWRASIVDLGGGAEALRLTVGAPEPSTLALAFVGLAACLLIGRRRR
jgi:fibronectin-binding autotransporter adhesin